MGAESRGQRSQRGLLWSEQWGSEGSPRCFNLGGPFRHASLRWWPAERHGVCLSREAGRAAAFSVVATALAHLLSVGTCLL